MRLWIGLKAPPTRAAIAASSGTLLTWPSLGAHGNSQDARVRLDAHNWKGGIMTNEKIERIEEELVDIAEEVFDEALDRVECSICIPNCRQ